MKLVKSIRYIVIFSSVMILLSCVHEYKRRNTHHKELWTIVNKYSDVLDIKRSNIDIGGAIYYLLDSSEPRIKLSLYLKPDTYNRETVIAIRDEFTAFFRNNARGLNPQPQYRYYENISIEFLLIENNETLTFYNVRYRKESEFRVWQSYGISKNRLAGFEEFISGEVSQYFSFRFWDVVQTANNGIGFELWFSSGNVEALRKMNIRYFPVESYLNGDEFNSFINNHEWISVDDDFHVTLFFTTPWDSLGNTAEFISYKSTDFSVWERRK